MAKKNDSTTLPDDMKHEVEPAKDLVDRSNPATVLAEHPDATIDRDASPPEGPEGTHKRLSRVVVDGKDRDEWEVIDAGGPAGDNSDQRREQLAYEAERKQVAQEITNREREEMQRRAEQAAAGDIDPEKFDDHVILDREIGEAQNQQ